MQFEGIFPPVATPFTDGGEIDYEALGHNLRFYYSSRLRGIVMLGSTGESVHLETDEKLELVRLASRLRPERKLLLAGVGGGSTKEAIAFARQLEPFPVSALLAAAPAYYKGQMQVPALCRYYHELADNAPFPLLLYNVPQFSGLELPVEAVAELSGHPRIVGMKDSSGDLIYLQRVQQRVQAGFEILTGSAQVWGPALMLGVRGAILALACALPDLAVDLRDAYRDGKDVTALQQRVFRVGQLLTSDYGIAGIKFAMDLVGLRGGHCRQPLLPVPEEGRRRIENALRRLGRLAEPSGEIS